MNDIKSNKDLMMREYSKAKDFAKDENLFSLLEINIRNIRENKTSS